MEVHGVKTWFDQRSGVVEVSDDVLGVVRDIKAIDARLSVYYNEQTDGFDIVEHCLDHTDRLVFSVSELDPRVVNRLRAADHWRGNDVPTHVLPDEEDYVTRTDRENEAIQAAHDERRREQVAEAGERLAWALKMPLKGNAGKDESILVPRSISASTSTRAHSKDESRGDSPGA